MLRVRPLALQGEAPDEHAQPAIEKIISGGQTGADRAALDFAIYHDIPHGGWSRNLM